MKLKPNITTVRMLAWQRGIPYSKTSLKNGLRSRSQNAPTLVMRFQPHGVWYAHAPMCDNGVLAVRCDPVEAAYWGYHTLVAMAARRKQTDGPGRTTRQKRETRMDRPTYTNRGNGKWAYLAEDDQTFDWEPGDHRKRPVA